MILNNAVEKLIKEKEEAIKNTGQKEKVICNPVFEVLCDFCRQEIEFAQAIYQTDKTFSACLKECVKGAGSAISDIDVYKKAVSFYFDGADINFSMTINLCASVQNNQTQNKNAIVLSLDDFI